LVIVDDMALSGGYVPDRVARLPTWLLATAAKRGHRLLGDHLSAERMRRQHYLVLAGLAELDAPAQAEVGRVLRVDTGDLVAILNDLQSAGYIRRERSRTDRRRNALTVTQAGHTALRRFDRLAEEANDALVACLSPTEREQLMSMLTRILLTAGTTIPVTPESADRHAEHERDAEADKPLGERHPQVGGEVPRPRDRRDAHPGR
jgi:DNA-binding MarR family transcriptional regulator